MLADNKILVLDDKNILFNQLKKILKGIRHSNQENALIGNLTVKHIDNPSKVITSIKKGIKNNQFYDVIMINAALFTNEIGFTRAIHCLYE